MPVTRNVVQSALIRRSKLERNAAQMSDGAARTNGETPLACTRHSQSSSAAMPTKAGTMYFSEAFMCLRFFFVARKRSTPDFSVLHLVDGVRMGRGETGRQSHQARSRFRRGSGAWLGERDHHPGRSPRLWRSPF